MSGPTFLVLGTEARRPKIVRNFLVALCVFGGVTGAKAAASRALVIGDDVRVRSKPSVKESTLLGVLFKNMTVKVLAEGSKPKNEGAIHWVKVRSGKIEGWVSRRFLDLKAKTFDVDTYDAEGNMQWFYKRFGYSTWFKKSAFNVNTFDTGQYREMMAAALAGKSGAHEALLQTLFPLLRRRPTEAKFRYLKKRLHSRDFLLKLPLGWDPRLVPYIPRVRFRDRAFVIGWLRQHWRGQSCAFVKRIDKKLMSDQEVKDALAPMAKCLKK